MKFICQICRLSHGPRLIVFRIEYLFVSNIVETIEDSELVVYAICAPLMRSGAFIFMPRMWFACLNSDASRVLLSHRNDLFS